MSIFKALWAALTDDPHPLISQLTFEQGTRKPVYLSLREAGSECLCETWLYLESMG